MKKLLLSLGAVALSLSMSAQTASIKPFKLEGALQKQSVGVASTMKKAPRKALAENQLWMGNYSSDTYNSYNSGFGLVNYPGEITIASEIPASAITGFDGGKMVGMRIGLALDTNVSEMFIYGVTAEGSLTEVADVAHSGGSEGWNEITFDDPQTVDLSANVEYLVGYTYTQTSENYPFTLVAEGDTYQPTLAYGDFGQGEGWYNIGASSYGNLAVQVLVEKDFAKDAVSGVSCKDVYAQLGEAGELNFVLNNQGTHAVENVTYTVTCDGTTGDEQSVDIAAAPTFGQNFTLTLPVEAMAECGTKEYTVTITKVNGEDNACENNTVTGKFITVKKLFTHRVAVEEFTGTGCGYCPRGWVAMNLLREKYGDDFVGVAIHQYNSSDPMYIKPASYAALSFSGAPSSMVERGDEVDPYYGTSEEIMGIYKDFDAAKAEIAAAGVEVSGVWNEDKTQVNATASVQSLTDNAKYDIEFVLIADGLNTSTWAQSNYYYQYTASQADATGTPLADFCKGGTYAKSSVKGLTFNDVAIASSYSNKKNTVDAITIPTAYTPVESTCTMTMPTKTALVNAIKNADYDVYVIALVIDPTTGKVVNAVKSKVQEAGAVVTPTDLEFADAEGNQIADGATIVMDKAETNDWDETQVALTGLYVKNTTEDDINGRLTATIDNFLGTSFACCFGASCRNLTKAGSLVIDGVNVPAGESVEVSNTEWVVGEEYGTLPVKFTLDAADGLDYSTMATITVNFVYANPDGINTVNADSQNGVAYNLAGQRVNKAQKGLYIYNGKKVVK